MTRYWALPLVFAAACGLTRFDSLDGDAGSDAASRDAARDADAHATHNDSEVDVEDGGRRSDAPAPDAPGPDATEDGFAPDGALRGNCMPLISECPNAATALEIGTPFAIGGALVLNQADDIPSTCGGGGTSDWTLAVTAMEPGLLNVQFSSSARYGVELRRDSCTGSLLSCGVTDGMQMSTSIEAGETYVIAVEAAATCDAPFELVLMLQDA